MQGLSISDKYTPLPAGAGSTLNRGFFADNPLPQYTPIGSPSERDRIRQGGAGYQAMRDYALSAPGQSPWEKMMMDRQSTEQAQARDLASQQASGLSQGIWNQMAMRGGAGLGARERAAQLGRRAGFSGLQDVARQGQLARADIGLRGEEKRLGLLQQLPGMELEREKYGAGLTQQDFENMMRQWELKQKDWAAAQMSSDIMGRR